MVAINFPDSPTNGQEHSGYVWDATNNVWNRLPTLPALDLVNFSAVAPSNPQDGQFWFDTTAGKMYVYYNDGSSAQWVSTLGGLVGQTGTEGQYLIHDGTEWLASDPPPARSGRNLLYNGAMQVAQRGTSETGITGDGYYTADRWYYNVSGADLGTWTQTVEADGPTGSGFTKSLKMECTTANAALDAGDLAIMEHRFEGQDLQGVKKGTSSAESLTLSFWVKSNVTGTYVVWFNDIDNTRSVSAAYSVSASGTWEKKTVTIAGDTTGAFDNDNGLSLILRFGLAAGTNYTSGTLQTSWGATSNADTLVGQTNLGASTSNYWQITGVQLETGEVATPFEHKSYGVELAECQRYYQVFVEETGTDKPFINGSMYRTDRFYSDIKLSPPMRSAPSLDITTGTNFYVILANTSNESFTGSDISLGLSRETSVEFYINNRSLTAGSAAWVRGSLDGSFVALDAEL